ncbi:MAG: DUF565 domain-containing protein [Leptolyngbya sp. RL_3_1]|nr:DUF565 domain-containing protein [Leptolyngbya sp. RL_3_1]
MQRTRLTTLIETLSNRFGRWVFNPWRRLSLVIISLLFGNFFGTAISTIAGQTADFDVFISALLVLGVEGISWLFYRRPRQPEARPSLALEVSNAFKLGLVYGLFVEAFKLGS